MKTLTSLFLISATSAILSYPGAVLADDKGGFYVFDAFWIRYVAANGVIRTVVGNGAVVLTPDGVAGLEYSPGYIRAMARSANGELYFVDPQYCIVSRLDAQGIVRRVAGIPRDCGFSGDRGPAASAKLNDPTGIAFDPQGRLVIADRGNHRIRRVNADGVIETIGGTGDSQTFAAEGLSALQSPISSPVSVAVATDGTVYFAETSYRRVRRIAPDGRIATVAGTGEIGHSGDGGPATAARFGIIELVALDAPRNRLFICDSEWHRVRVVSLASATISNAAGIFIPSLGAPDSPAASFSGDNGPAVSAGLSSPSGIAVEANGSLLIADTVNHRVRRADTTIRTVAGRFRDTAEGPAARAEMIFPRNFAATPAGDLLIADAGNRIIRRLTRSGTISIFAGT